MRSFHATNDSGEDCPTLGYSRQQLDVPIMTLSQLNKFNFIDLTYSPTCCGRPLMNSCIFTGDESF
jgi:hypothetical protein